MFKELPDLFLSGKTCRGCIEWAECGFFAQCCLFLCCVYSVNFTFDIMISPNDLAYVARSSLVYDLQFDTIVLVIQFHCN